MHMFENIVTSKRGSWKFKAAAACTGVQWSWDASYSLKTPSVPCLSGFSPMDLAVSCGYFRALLCQPTPQTFGQSETLDPIEFASSLK